MVRKILCPTDFSDCSEHALQVAVRLAIEHEAELVIAHVWYLAPLMFAGEEPFPADTLEVMNRESERALAAAARDATSRGAKRVTTKFLNGLPWDRIVQLLADDPAYDLVVMGTQGRSGLARVLLGSTTEKVIRHAPCSVLAVRADGAQPFAHVLCPVDFSDSSRHAMHLAGELVARASSSVTLMHVVDVPSSYTRDPSLVAYLSSMKKLASQTLQDWAGDLRATIDAPVITRTAVGSPVAHALAEIDEHPEIDLVVVGSHGRTGLRRLLLGSVAEKLLRHARCPVLVTRHRTRH